MVYIAFLRGINVGGKNIIKMSDLKQMFATIGLSDAITYIQSGNIIFSSDETENILLEKIESAIFNTFGLSVPVILRTLPELEQISTHHPFSEKDIELLKENAEGEVFYLFLFNDDISDSNIQKIYAAKKEKEKLQIAKRDVYVLFDKTIRDSKLAGAIQRIENHCTSRNIKTINKLVDLGKNNFI